MQQIKKPKALKEELLQEHEAQNMGTTRGDMGHSLWGPPAETPWTTRGPWRNKVFLDARRASRRRIGCFVWGWLLRMVLFFTVKTQLEQSDTRPWLDVWTCQWGLKVHSEQDLSYFWALAGAVPPQSAKAQASKPRKMTEMANTETTINSTVSHEHIYQVTEEWKTVRRWLSNLGEMLTSPVNSKGLRCWVNLCRVEGWVSWV